MALTKQSGSITDERTKPSKSSASFMQDTVHGSGGVYFEGREFYGDFCSEGFLQIFSVEKRLMAARILATVSLLVHDTVSPFVGDIPNAFASFIHSCVLWVFFNASYARDSEVE